MNEAKTKERPAASPLTIARRMLLTPAGVLKECEAQEECIKKLTEAERAFSRAVNKYTSNRSSLNELAEAMIAQMKAFCAANDELTAKTKKIYGVK
jgi:phage host-nuclease inhibitor protein Gam